MSSRASPLRSLTFVAMMQSTPTSGIATIFACTSWLDRSFVPRVLQKAQLCAAPTMTIAEGA